MKVLYLASNPLGSSSLRLEHEITELQRAAIQSGNQRIDFVFLPALPFEDLEAQVAAHRPDIVHISAHGDADKLMIADSAENKVALTAEALRVLLSPQPPKLVYLNACTSREIAKQLVGSVQFAIGTDEAITNFAARKGALTFYRMLLRGRNLQQAFDASSATITVLSKPEKPVKTELFPENSPRANAVVFHEPTRLVASFEDHDFKADEEDCYSFALGLAGCTPDTTQVVFCTDDESFIEKVNATDHATELCSVVRTTTVNGEIWLHDPWGGIAGNFRLFAMATTAAGETYSIAGTLVEALDNFYRVYYGDGQRSEYPTALQQAISELHANDGAQLRPQRVPARSPRRRTPQG